MALQIKQSLGNVKLMWDLERQLREIKFGDKIDLNVACIQLFQETEVTLKNAVSK